MMLLGPDDRHCDRQSLGFGIRKGKGTNTEKWVEISKRVRVRNYKPPTKLYFATSRRSRNGDRLSASDLTQYSAVHPRASDAAPHNQWLLSSAVIIYNYK